MPTTTPKAEMLDNLRAMLRDVFRLRTEGVTYARLARAHGYVDGYMRVLLYLEEVFGRPVDLVLENSVREELLQQIMDEVLYAEGV